MSEESISKEVTQNNTMGSSSPDVKTESDLLCTPKRLIHPRLDFLAGECRSPALQIPASPMMQRLGYGTGVGVFLMERSPRINGEIRSPWAIKKIANLKTTKKVYADRLEQEAAILKRLNHPNIIGYRGFGKPGQDAAYLAMESATASLSDIIEKRMESFMDETGQNSTPVVPFPAANINRVAEDVAKALAYLHDEIRIIHGDLKSANVLVFGDFANIKLCDFGVSRKLNDQGLVQGGYVGTEIWTPLEVIRKQKKLPHEPITNKVDIYPYGLTLFEMISLKPPHLPTADDCCNTNDSFDEDAFEEILAECVGTRPLLPDFEFDSSYNNILALFYCCTDESPLKRPGAKDILKFFASEPIASGKTYPFTTTDVVEK